MQVKLFTIIILSAVFQHGWAQQKIGASPTSIQSGQLLQLEKKGNRGGLKIAEVSLSSTLDLTTINIPTSALGTMVWNTATAGSGELAVAPGFYVWNGTAWDRLSTMSASNNIYMNNGILTDSRLVEQQTNSLNFTSTASAGTSHFTVDGTTFNVDALNNRVGIGTAAPLTSLTVGSSDGLTPGKIALNPTNATDEGGQLTFVRSPSFGTKNFYIDQYGGNGSTQLPRLRIFGQGSTESISITEDAFVGAYGISTPTTPLHVGGAVRIGTSTQTAAVAGEGAIRYNNFGMIERSDGVAWSNLNASLTFGDIKTGTQTADHNGWILLNGRAISTLTATQQAVAVSLGLSANIPNASNAYLVQNGQTLGSVTGSNTVTIAQNQLPNVVPSFTISGASAGTPTGTVAVANTTASMQSAGNHSHTLTRRSNSDQISFDTGNGRQDESSAMTTDQPNLGPFSTSTAGAHTHTMNAHAHTATFTGAALANHTHTVTPGSINGNVTQQAINITKRSASVNVFLYLGN